MDGTTRIPHWHTLSKSSNIQSEQHYTAFTRDKLFFPRNRKHALDMNYKHWVNFLSAADNVSIESDSMNIHPEFLADHMDIPIWHFIKMVPVHGACAPIQLTALVQINCFATYKSRRSVDKFHVPITVEQLTSGQKYEKKTEPGANRKVAVDGQRFDSRRTHDYFHTKDKFDEFVEDHHERQNRDCHAKHLHRLRCVQFWKTAAHNLEIIPMITHTKCVGRLQHR